MVNNNLVGGLKKKTSWKMMEFVNGKDDIPTSFASWLKHVEQ